MQLGPQGATGKNKLGQTLDILKQFDIYAWQVDWHSVKSVALD